MLIHVELDITSVAIFEVDRLLVASTGQRVTQVSLRNPPRPVRKVINTYSELAVDRNFSVILF